METVDIVNLIQQNPITRLTDNYNSRLITKLKEHFKEPGQQHFIANFYMYLNYNQRTDFVIDFDLVWNWLGYTRIDNCKTVLYKNFKKDIDYKIISDERSCNNKDSDFNQELGSADFDGNKSAYMDLDGNKAAPATSGAKNTVKDPRGGHNKEKIMMTTYCFKKLCMKVETTKAEEIHEYYIKLEEILNEVLAEESAELREKLYLKDKLNNDESLKTLMDNFRYKRIVYLIQVDESTIKYGYTDDIERRMSCHRKEFGPQIILRTVFETVFNREFEKIITNHITIRPHIIKRTYKTNQTELIHLDSEFTYDVLLNEVTRLKNGMSEDVVRTLMQKIDALDNVKVENEQLKQTNTVLLKKIKYDPFCSYNITTGEIRYFRAYKYAERISGIGPKSLRDNYINKPVQHRGNVYFAEGNRYWKPPHNFKFDPDASSTTHMIMCKSVNKETGEVTYYNSMKEAAKLVGLFDGVAREDTAVRKLIWMCDNNMFGRESTNEILNKYYWYKVHSCGQWVHPGNGNIEDIEEQIITKDSSGEKLINLQELSKLQETYKDGRRKVPFIDEANHVHNNKYDYSQTKYETTRKKVTIICPSHGPFEKTPERHLMGHGCPMCSIK